MEITTIEQELEWAINGAKTWTDMMKHFDGKNHSKYTECKTTRDEYLRLITNLNKKNEV